MEPSTPITFFVPGVPAPGGSKRGFYIPALKRVVITDACKRNKPWQECVRAAALQAYKGEPLTCALHMAVTFLMPRPKSHFGSGKHAAALKPSAPRYHTQKPDATKLMRSLEDALTGIVWRDDSQVVSPHPTKGWTIGTPGAVVTIMRLDESAPVEPDPTLPFKEPKRTHVGGYRLAEPQAVQS